LSGILVPSQGALLGHYYGNGTLAQTDAIIGRKPALHLAYFNWGQSFQDVFMNIYPLLAAKGKPILIGEMASDEVGGSKAQWIADIVPTMKTSFPMIKAFAWFDVMKERNWEINSSASAAAAYAQMARDPYMNP
jgi:hypothetical protein